MNFALGKEYMSQPDSARALATMVFTALLVIILLSSTRTTYQLSPATEPAKGGYALAACEARPATVAPQPRPPRACPWLQTWPHALPQPPLHSWPHDARHWARVPVPNVSVLATPGHALLGDLPD
jgi:hypothetical protein